MQRDNSQRFRGPDLGSRPFILKCIIWFCFVGSNCKLATIGNYYLQQLLSVHYLSVGLFVCLYVCLYVCLTICPFVYCLPVCLYLHHCPVILTTQLTLGCGRPVEVFSKAGSSRPARLWANSKSSSLYSLVERGPKGSSGSLISRWADSSEPSTLGATRKRQVQIIYHLFMKLSLPGYKYQNNELEEASVIFVAGFLLQYSRSNRKDTRASIFTYHYKKPYVR